MRSDYEKKNCGAGCLYDLKREGKNTPSQLLHSGEQEGKLSRNSIRKVPDGPCGPKNFTRHHGGKIGGGKGQGSDSVTIVGREEKRCSNGPVRREGKSEMAGGKEFHRIPGQAYDQRTEKKNWTLTGNSSREQCASSKRESDTVSKSNKRGGKGNIFNETKLLRAGKGRMDGSTTE